MIFAGNGGAHTKYWLLVAEHTMIWLRGPRYAETGDA